MSDYANLRELYYEALQLIPEGAATAQGDRKMSEGLRRDLEAYGGRNPEPKPEPALLRARNQAEWHNAQQALVVSETPPEELAMAMGVSDGVEPSKQQGERMHEQRAQQSSERIEVARRDVEQMRAGTLPASGIGRSGTQPASTPGTVPAPVQGQVPPVEMTHREAHQQYAEAHRQAAGTHQGSDNPSDAQAAAAHQQQADIHEMESHGTPNAPEVPATAADEGPQTAAKEQVAGQTQVTQPPPADAAKPKPGNKTK